MAPHLTHLGNLFPLALSVYHHTFRFFGSSPSRPPSSSNDSHELHFPPPADSGARGVWTFQLSHLSFLCSLEGYIASVSSQQPPPLHVTPWLLRGLCHLESNAWTSTVGSELLQILLPKQRGSSRAPCGYWKLHLSSPGGCVHSLLPWRCHVQRQLVDTPTGGTFLGGTEAAGKLTLMMAGNSRLVLPGKLR